MSEAFIGALFLQLHSLSCVCMCVYVVCVCVCVLLRLIQFNDLFRSFVFGTSIVVFDTVYCVV